MNSKYFLVQAISVLVAVVISFTSHAESLSPKEEAMLAWVDQRADQILEELRQHVDINTGSANIAGLNQYRTLLAEDLRELGFETETVSSDSFEVLSCDAKEVEIADHLVARKTTVLDKPRVLLNGHMDTVFSVDDDFQSLQILDDGTLKGPGVADMKGGIVIMLNALRALNEQSMLDEVNATVLLNSDEEIGSLGSRALIESLAKQHDVGMIYEGTYQNLMTHSRKGLGQARLKIIGRESHAGSAHQNGVSANRELAHKVVEIEKLTDYDRKVTANTGVMSGGEKRNTVPGCADAHIDFRFPDAESGEKMLADFKSIVAQASTHNPQHPEFPKIESWAVSHRPAKAQNDQVDAIIKQAIELSALIGEPVLGTRYSGGGTDGSIAQSVGLATADSLGMDGSGAHSSREQSSVRSLIARTKLAAVMLARQLHTMSNQEQDQSN